jgi:hypothetical protein
VTELRVRNFSVSVDGYGAGPSQSEEDPLGIGGEQLHEWIFAPDATDVDRRFRALGDEDIGATIMDQGPPSPRHSQAPGGPLREAVGQDPPFHHDVFVLTHHARDPSPWPGGRRSTS